MTTEVNGTEPQENEEKIDLFAKDMDDKVLLDQDPAITPDSEALDAAKPVAKEEDGLPAKYQGKSIHEIVEMHQNLEKAYGRHNNELGELRKVTETYLQQQLGGNKDAQPAKKLDADALLEDPETVLRNTVENNPRLKEIEAKLVARERADNLTAFNQAHPNAKDQLNDPRFAKWVTESPTRQRLLAQADQAFDYDLMGELLTTFSALTGEEQQQTANKVKDTLTNAKPSGGAQGGKKKPVFTRKQLAKLQIEDPRRYETLQDVIMDAYADDRVR